MHVVSLTYDHCRRRIYNIKLKKRSPRCEWTQLTQMGISQTGKGWGAALLGWKVTPVHAPTYVFTSFWSFFSASS